ncbi:nuclear transport factor 2 family protein [Pseudonocardia sp. KRD291]|uniref:nuclear transport factor 2 family protein n=1 Tax=Pseudonocardia sp. KRD291 TaxID=2792007 RepID=UPI001C49FE54|nr:nuclear transport factor 2 family protein [Pseudonocardia sp. KRD291]MBW0106085.1 nuclear transport factor 2 family protein [Pseudonocardia sp. KRD291]
MAGHDPTTPTPDIAAELAAVRHRLDVLESREEIRSLRTRFHDYVNTDRWDEIGGLFSADAELDYDYLGSASERQAIDEFFGAIPRLLPDGEGGPFVRQFSHAHAIAVDGETATGSSHLFATPVYHGQSFVVSARFADRYGRHDGTWLFDSVAMTVWYSVPLEQGWAGADRHHMRL